MSDYDENLSYIYDTLSDDDLKLQIVEEASELIQAICKLRRAPTAPIPRRYPSWTLKKRHMRKSRILLWLSMQRWTRAKKLEYRPYSM